MLRRKGFIIMTLIVPLVFLLGIVAFTRLSRESIGPSEEITKIGYVDNIGGFEQYTNQGNIQSGAF